MPVPSGPTLLGAVEQLLLNTSAVTAIVGTNVWAGQLPEGDTLPAVVMVHQGEERVYTSEVSYIQEGRLDLCCVAQGCANAEALALAVSSVMDGPSGGLPPWTVTGCFTTGSLQVKYKVNVLEQRAPSTEFVFEAVLTYLTRYTNQLAG